MFAALSFSIALLAPGSANGAPHKPSTPVEHGQQLAQENCGACHATGRTGESPLLPALPLRRLSSRFDIEGLPESLAEGISVGHPQMPQVVWEARDIEAFMAYLRTLQPTRPRAGR